jgi:hypothetical protein
MYRKPGPMLRHGRTSRATCSSSAVICGNTTSSSVNGRGWIDLQRAEVAFGVVFAQYAGLVFGLDLHFYAFLGRKGY